MFHQEYECEWTTTEDQVYESLDEEKHIGDFVGERFTEVIAGLDVGYRDENVFIVIGTNGKQYWVLDEFISKESTTSALASSQLLTSFLVTITLNRSKSTTGEMFVSLVVM